MKPHPFYLGLLLAAALTCPALQAAEPDSHRQAVETLFQLTHMEQKISESVASVAQLQVRQDPGLASKQDVLMAFLEKYIGWDAIRDDLARMYMQTFSEDELKVMNAFYITPTGQKVITIVPQLVQQRNQLAMQRLQDNIGELRAAIGNGN
ncbi:MAG: DUF2059 domain-containing protein [Gammaproteobacteria bacterium]